MIFCFFCNNFSSHSLQNPLQSDFFLYHNTKSMMAYQWLSQDNVHGHFLLISLVFSVATGHMSTTSILKHTLHLISKLLLFINSFSITNCSSYFPPHSSSSFSDLYILDWSRDPCLEYEFIYSLSKEILTLHVYNITGGAFKGCSLQMN